MKEELFIVCARADAPIMTAGSTFEHKCGKCSTPVMISISGTVFIRDNPTAVPICPSCIPEDGLSLRPAATPEQLAGELASIRPNMRRNRN